MKNEKKTWNIYQIKVIINTNINKYGKDFILKGFTYLSTKNKQILHHGTMELCKEIMSFNKNV